MIPANELRIGNQVFWNPKFVQSNAAERLPIEVASVSGDKMGYISPHLEHRVEFFDDGFLPAETHFESLEEIEPVPITKAWLSQLPETINYPDWIRYVHELQNWYYWNNNKTELPLDNL